jgi:hypothetical protein
MEEKNTYYNAVKLAKTNIMKLITSFLLTVILITVFTMPIYGQNTENVEPPREKWELVSMAGTVTNVVKETREITLKGADGELVTLIASDEVKRFDEIALGNVITFEYYTYLKAEFRAPTEEEIAAPLTLLVEAGKTLEGMDPGAAMGAIVKAIVTIEILNRPNMLATVRGPKGNYLTIQMKDKALIQRLSIGQKIILTYAEAIAVALEK